MDDAAVPGDNPTTADSAEDGEGPPAGPEPPQEDGGPTAEDDAVLMREPSQFAPGEDGAADAQGDALAAEVSQGPEADAPGGEQLPADDVRASRAGGELTEAADPAVAAEGDPGALGGAEGEPLPSPGAGTEGEEHGRDGVRASHAGGVVAEGAGSVRASLADGGLGGDVRASHASVGSIRASHAGGAKRASRTGAGKQQQQQQEREGPVDVRASHASLGGVAQGEAVEQGLREEQGDGTEGATDGVLYQGGEAGMDGGLGLEAEASVGAAAPPLDADGEHGGHGYGGEQYGEYGEGGEYAEGELAGGGGGSGDGGELRPASAQAYGGTADDGHHVNGVYDSQSDPHLGDMRRRSGQGALAGVDSRYGDMGGYGYGGGGAGGGVDAEALLAAEREQHAAQLQLEVRAREELEDMILRIEKHFKAEQAARKKAEELLQVGWLRPGVHGNAGWYAREG